MKRLYWLIAIVILSGSFYPLFLSIKPIPPNNELKEARRSINAALGLRSHIYSETMLRKAQVAYDSAMLLWERENLRFILMRNYEQVKKLALESTLEAKMSMQTSGKKEANLKELTTAQVNHLDRQITTYQKVFENMPVKDGSAALTQIKLLYQEGLMAYQKNNYIQARKQLDQAEILIKELHTTSKNILKTYFEAYPGWKESAQKTIAESKKYRNTCMVIDKYARNCHLYNSGKLIRTYKIELGTNWMGDKQHQGDKSTPEGTYQVIQLKSAPQTKYFKALLLNYPNEDDKKRFSLNKKNGIIDPAVPIGGLIEIHGQGGKGIDWTDGCIALPDRDMETLYAESKVGTNVTIVGSLKPLNEIISNSP